MAENESINLAYDEKFKHLENEIKDLKQQTITIKEKADINQNGRLIDKVQNLIDNLQLDNRRRDEEKIRNDEKQEKATEKQTQIISGIGESVNRVSGTIDTLKGKLETLEIKVDENQDKQIDLTKRFEDGEKKTQIDTSTLTKTIITIGSSTAFLAVLAFILKYVLHLY